MKKITLALLLLLTFACQSQNEEGTQNVNVAEFKAAFTAEENPLIIDVRTDEEVAEGMIKGAQQIDFYAEDFEAQIDQLDKDQTVYIYCRSGGRSGNAMAMMHKMGFKHIVNLDGGMNAWKSAGEATE